MQPKDRQTLAQWFATGATLREVCAVDRIGLVGNERFSEQARRAYVLAWKWSASRFSGAIGVRQDALHARHGAQFLQRRFDRVNRMIGRLIQEHQQ